MTDKFPCATCEDFPTCEPAKKMMSDVLFFENNGFPVTKICITCPKDGFTYTARKPTRTGEIEALKRNTAADPEPGRE